MKDLSQEGKKSERLPVRVPVYLRRSTHQRIKDYCAARDMPITYFLKIVLEQYLDEEEKKAGGRK